MAQFDDALAGWEIFHGRNGQVSRAQLNAGLRSRNKEPISERTYSHYRKLRRLGYDDYVSINRLDIRHANEAVFDSADRARYTDTALSSPARLVIPSATGVSVLTGDVGRISEGYATLRVAATEAARSAARAIKYDKGILIFDQVGVERAVEVTEALDRGSQLDLILAFRSLLDVSLVAPRTEMPSASANIRVNLGVEAPLFELVVALHRTFDLFESVRGVLDLAVQGGPGSAPQHWPAPRVKRLAFSNPLELLLISALGIVTVGSLIVKRVSSGVQSGVDAASKVQSFQHAKSEETRRQERHEIEVRSLQLDQLKKSIEVAELIDAAAPSVWQIAGLQLTSPPSAMLERAEGLKNQAVEATAELLAGGTADVSITIESPKEP